MKLLCYPALLWLGDTWNCILTGIANMEGAAQFSVSTNPASAYIEVSSHLPLQHLSIFTMDGPLLFNSQNNQMTQKINILDYEPGVYLLKTT